jgi:F-type H+-transporting ATPase subunit delta
MAELSTLARPYAKAAFEYARDKQTLSQWQQQLASAAAVTTNDVIQGVLNNPSLTSNQQAQILRDVSGDAMGVEVASFVDILASNKRLALLPGIYDLFVQYKANQERSVSVEVVSAFELDASTEQTLAEVLKKKLDRDVSVVSVIDKSLLGGILIRAGDLVIDGSVRGRLNKLAEAMNL